MCCVMFFSLPIVSGREGEGGVLVIDHFLCISYGQKKMAKGVWRGEQGTGSHARTHTNCSSVIMAVTLTVDVHILSLPVYCFPSCFLPLLPPVAQTTLPWQPEYMRDGALRWDDSERRGEIGNTPVWVCMNACMHSGGGLWLVHTRPIYTIISFNVVCGLSGEIKANEMWQMKANMKTESWAPSIPKHI